MEQKKNFLQHTVQDNTLLPIELEMLGYIKSRIESHANIKIDSCERFSRSPLYDSYLIISDKRAFVLKVNLSPFIPNFWDKLCLNNFPFHPSVVSYDLSGDFNYICFEMPKGIFASDISKYLLSPRLKLESFFARDLKKIHSFSSSSKDETLETINSFLPMESAIIQHTFPVAQLFGAVKSRFKNIYTPSLSDCAICHFDLDLSNIIFSRNEFKFINFEYAANANKYIDIWLAKEVLNCSDSDFESFVSIYEADKEKLLSLKEAAELFIFAYMNSKIVSEFMTFGVANPTKLSTYINKSQMFYSKIKDKLFIEETLDKTIQGFYLLWRS
jgi:thiamine kinase-like enzyme